MFVTYGSTREHTTKKSSTLFSSIPSLILTLVTRPSHSGRELTTVNCFCLPKNSSKSFPFLTSKISRRIILDYSDDFIFEFPFLHKSGFRFFADSFELYKHELMSLFRGFQMPNFKFISW